MAKQISSEQNEAEEQLCLFTKALYRMGVSRDEIIRQIDSALEEAFNEADDGCVVDAVFVSVWSEGYEVKTPCKLDVCNGHVFDIEVSDDETPSFADACEGEYVENPNGNDRLEVEQAPDGEYYVVEVEKEQCSYCGGNCPNEDDDSENLCDGFAGNIDGLYE